MTARIAIHTARVPPEAPRAHAGEIPRAGELAQWRAAGCLENEIDLDIEGLAARRDRVNQLNTPFSLDVYMEGTSS